MGNLQCSRDHATLRRSWYVATDIAERTRRHVDRRLMPFVFLLYLISYLDRVNVGFAGLQMTRELGFSNYVFGLGGGIFFIGYFLLEVPGFDSGGSLERPQMDRSHHDHLGLGGIAHGTDPQRAAVLLAALYSGYCRGRFRPRHHRIFEPLVSPGGSRQGNRDFLRGHSGVGRHRRPALGDFS